MSGQAKQNLTSLGSVSMCVAMDKSGSTWGKTLATEVSVVKEICRLRASTNIHPVNLLPWCDSTLKPIKLPENNVAMEALTGGGGTNPGVLYKSEDCLKIIQDSDLWFLLTDGQIDDRLVENFALQTTKSGVHNKSVVIIVFDSFSAGPPFERNISVGIALYAVTPNSLFLFYDLSSGKIKLMQAKGSFASLLPRKNNEYVQPKISKWTTWAELPQVALEDLQRVQVASVMALTEQEMALPDGLIVKMEDLLSGDVDPGTIEQIMKNDDNLKSIVLASMMRGTGKELDAFLESQKLPMPERSTLRHDVGQAQKAVTQLLEALNNHSDKDELERLRQALRKAHEKNVLYMKHQRRDEDDRRVQAVAQNQKMRWGQNRGLLKKGKPDRWDLGDNMGDVDEWDCEQRDWRREEAGMSADQVFLPGFIRKEPIDEFKGNCMLCRRDSVLALLLKAPPSFQTPNFPDQGSYSRLTFPLAMGSFAELDVMSYFVCCDCCAHYLVHNGMSPEGETIINALCLVGVNNNQGAWLERLEAAVRGRFEIKDLWAIYLAILDKMITENDMRRAAAGAKSLFSDAASWVVQRLEKITQVSSTLSPAFGAQDSSQLTVLSDILANEKFNDPGRTDNVDIYLLRYPLPGFPAIFRLLRNHLGADQLRQVLFQRLVFHLIEAFFSERGGTAISPQKQTLLDKMLGLDTSDGIAALQQDNIVAEVAVGMLVDQNLLEPGVISSFRAIPEFEDIERQARPALAVFLHYLTESGRLYTSSVACFNALKGNSSTREVLQLPLKIDQKKAKGVISQIHL
ncbi:uncharacterized protein Z518_00490 [Rhinocladiella mackenziei CBS 650.93]|uniref:Uncharacterized protein n=1 Tax=Rhinocladiella mackenziei CBS 650.93 TaxID=1442369 RepID=A0A0D2JJ18_9EURO|nr:uncharacterized protein Z518_00490 [Rhinocladiella mackenziei CBS 650.93]KIX09410.1 hypothetical protein Z518_00490 [Rhinocladiella mackenziei CBS 650.93]